MSILIEDMKMPEHGQCKTITIFDDGTVVQADGSEILGHAIPIPPHGNLIDRDTLTKFLDDTVDDNEICFNVYNADWIYGFIESAPTVIEAEEGET